MIRAVLSRFNGVAKTSSISSAVKIQHTCGAKVHKALLSTSSARQSAEGHFASSEDDFDNRFVEYFNNPQIDAWQLRTGINNLQGCDVIPEPKIVTAALKACRRLNDHSAAVRILEAVKWKCYRGTDEAAYNWVIQEVKPTLDELGISTPEELGYGEPELWLEDVYDMHGPEEPASPMQK